MSSRPDFSRATTSVCEAICGTAVEISFSKSICRFSANLARLSKRSASASWPAARSWSAFADAAAALAPHSLTASSSVALSASSIRRLPIVVAVASSASAMLVVKSRISWSSIFSGSSAWSISALMFARVSWAMRPMMDCFWVTRGLLVGGSGSAAVSVRGGGRTFERADGVSAGGCCGGCWTIGSRTCG